MLSCDSQGRARFLCGVVKVLSGDDVEAGGVDQGLAGLDDLPGHVDVGPRRRRVAGGVVVDQPRRMR